MSDLFPLRNVEHGNPPIGVSVDFGTDLLEFFVLVAYFGGFETALENLDCVETVLAVAVLQVRTHQEVGSELL